MHHSNARKGHFPHFADKDSEKDSDWLYSTSSETTKRKCCSGHWLHAFLCNGRLTVTLRVGNETPEMPSLGAVLQVTLRLILNLLPHWEGPEILEMEEEDV